MKLIMIGGLQATGKTTLMRRIRTLLGHHTKKSINTLHYEEYDSHVVLGKYGGEIFDGTDKLSMAVISDALKFLETNKKTVLLEGDRLFNIKFLDSAIKLGYDLKIIVCEVRDTKELLKRYKSRGKMQNQSFIKGRLTKQNKIINRYFSNCVILDTTNTLNKSMLKSIIDV